MTKEYIKEFLGQLGIFIFILLVFLPFATIIFGILGLVIIGISHIVSLSLLQIASIIIVISFICILHLETKRSIRKHKAMEEILDKRTKEICGKIKTK